jgi:hypothetical protein
MNVTQEPEGLVPSRVGQAALILGVLSVLSVVAAWLVLVPSPGALDRGLPRPPAAFGEPAHIETAPFAGIPAPVSRAAARARLARYGWVDRPAGIVHVPIERAMELYLAAQQATPAGGDAGAAGP